MQKGIFDNPLIDDDDTLPGKRFHKPDLQGQGIISKYAIVYFIVYLLREVPVIENLTIRFGPRGTKIHPMAYEF